MPIELKRFIQERCFDYGTLYSLEESFNRIGLTIQPTCGGDMILCRLIEGKPVAESLGDDHLYVGTQSRPRDEMPHKLIKCVLEFIDAVGSSPAVVVSQKQPSRTGHAGFYGKAFGVGPIMQDMALAQTQLNENLLGAIKDWCDTRA